MAFNLPGYTPGPYKCGGLVGVGTPVWQPPPKGQRYFGYEFDEIENQARYQPGGFHPVHLGDTFSYIPRTQQARYRIVLKLGVGLFSTVWMAEDLSEARKYVALKFLVADASSQYYELGILNQIRRIPPEQPGRKHVLSILDTFYVDGPNGSHRVLVSDVVIPVPHLHENLLMRPYARKLSSQAWSGLACLHDFGIVHGDLHVGNLAVAVNLENLSLEDLKAAFLGEPTIPVQPLPGPDPTSLPQHLTATTHLLYYLEDRGMVDHDSVCLKIIDFGSAFIAIDPSKSRPPVTTPREIAGPECRVYDVTDGAVDDRGLWSDVWTLACTTHELFIGYSFMSTYLRQANALDYIIRFGGPLPLPWQAYWQHNRPLDIMGRILPLDDYEGAWAEQEGQLKRSGKLTEDMVDSLLDFLKRVIRSDPSERPTAAQALGHPLLQLARS